MSFETVAVTFAGAVGFVFGGITGAAIGVAIITGVLIGLALYVTLA